MEEDKKEIFLRECQILKTNQFQAFEVWNSLEVAAPLKLVDLKNEKDKIGVAFCGLTDEENKKSEEEKKALKGEDHTIGVLSKEDADLIKGYVEQGWADKVYKCFLSKSDKKADEGKRFNVAIFIRTNPEKEGVQDQTGSKGEVATAQMPKDDDNK